MTNFSIRLMTESDTDKVEEFYNSIVDIKYSHTTYSRLVRPNTICLLLTTKSDKDETIVGISTAMRIWHDSFSTKREAYLSTFGIAKNFRNRGLGTYFLKATIYILSHYYTCIRLMCDVPKFSYETFEFFRKNGFNGQKIINNFYGMKNGSKEQSVFMMKMTDDNNNIEKPKTDLDIYLEPEVQHLFDNVQTFGFFEKIFAKP